ncbi:MAG TPA: decaprenyl-phosphate phosphoribosyltransferase [Alphaproteobacteria bacterium]|nr:decaprenyl-phosphate phosphoribosyltransferase [Alphaproteobacteria bacterium]
MIATQKRQALALLHLLRPRQWVKNSFVAAPLFFTPSVVSFDSAFWVGLGILCFCALSSAVYILNDYVDREADRLHAVKRSRPLAAGTVSPMVALVLMGVLILAGFVGAFSLDLGFGLIGAAYFALNLSYSFGLKRVSILDVMMVALGFVLRVYAGGALIGVSPTVWIIVCTGLLALFLALAKRRDDLSKGLGGEHRASLAGYSTRFLDTSVAIVLGALVVSYMIYTTELENRHRFGTDQLFITTPFVIAAVLRYLQITIVEERSGSPTDIVLTDRFLVLAALGWLATFGWLIYR